MDTLAREGNLSDLLLNLGFLEWTLTNDKNYSAAAIPKQTQTYAHDHNI